MDGHEDRIPRHSSSSRRSSCSEGSSGMATPCSLMLTSSSAHSSSSNQSRRSSSSYSSSRRYRRKRNPFRADKVRRQVQEFLGDDAVQQRWTRIVRRDIEDFVHVWNEHGEDRRVRCEDRIRRAKAKLMAPKSGDGMSFGSAVTPYTVTTAASENGLFLQQYRQRRQKDRLAHQRPGQTPLLRDGPLRRRMLAAKVKTSTANENEQFLQDFKQKRREQHALEAEQEQRMNTGKNTHAMADDNPSPTSVVDVFNAEHDEMVVLKEKVSSMKLEAASYRHKSNNQVDGRSSAPHHHPFDLSTSSLAETVVISNTGEIF